MVLRAGVSPTVLPLVHQVAIHSSFHHLLDKLPLLTKKSSDTDLAVKVTWATVTARVRVEVRPARFCQPSFENNDRVHTSAQLEVSALSTRSDESVTRLLEEPFACVQNLPLWFGAGSAVRGDLVMVSGGQTGGAHGPGRQGAGDASYPLTSCARRSESDSTCSHPGLAENPTTLCKTRLL
eukprot:6319728-Pyramimonas_sp.AAC.1